MAETSNIARMAEKVSSEIFGVLGWERIGPVDQNWICVNAAHEKRTHPSDVVFSYDDPYRPERVIWNVDLKSYAADTITKPKLAEAIKSLAKAVECANVSPEWNTLYGDDENRWRCDGLLFVYNHDGDFDKDFPDFLLNADASAFDIAAKRRLAVLGPPDVSYLVNVTHDLTRLRGLGEIPLDRKCIEFWYPDMVRPKLRPQSRSAATIEMLTGPWMTILIRPEHNNGRHKFLIYYRERGSTVDEFKYLIDSFFRFQILLYDRDAEIEVRLVNPAREAVSCFGKAKSAIESDLYGLAKNRLEPVRCNSISNVVKNFSEVELGLESR